MQPGRSGITRLKVLWSGVSIALLVTGTVYGAIAKVQDLGTASDVLPNQTTLSITVPGVAAGDSIIVEFVMDLPTGAVSVSDSAGNAYTTDADVGVSVVGQLRRTIIFSSHNVAGIAAGGTITVTFPNLSTLKAFSAAEFSGLAPTSPLDRISVASNLVPNTNPSSGPTAMTSQADELLIGAIGVLQPVTSGFTPGSGYSVLQRAGASSVAGDITIDPEFRIVSATGSYQADGTLSAAALWSAAIATYRAFLPPPTSTSTPTSTQTPPLTSTSSPTLTATNTATASQTPTLTATATTTATFTSTQTPSVTPTLTFTATPTPSATLTSTPSLTPSSTPSQTPIFTSTQTPTTTPTPTSTPTVTPTFSVTPASTLTPTSTQTPTFTLTATATAAFTSTPTTTPTLTLTPAGALTPTTTAAQTPILTATATLTSTQTQTLTQTQTPTLTATGIANPTVTATSVATATGPSPTAPPGGATSVPDLFPETRLLLALGLAAGALFLFRRIR